MIDDIKLLKILEKDCRAAAEDIATMLGADAADVAAAIRRLEEANVIIGYPALVDWDKTDEDSVTALIEVNVTPQMGNGYDRLAARIYQYDEVESLYLMSGTYDYAVMISGRTLKEVARFVIEKLSPIEGVTSTATHFILTKYKDKHKSFSAHYGQEERPLFI